jgi:hypothetical protein
LDRDTVTQLIRFAEEDRWGKQKPAPIQPSPLCVESFFAQRCQPGTTADRGRAPSMVVGLELLGPGGGPWCLELDEEGTIGAYSRGLPAAGAAPIATLPVKLIRLLDDDPADAVGTLVSLLQHTDGMDPAHQSALTASLSRPRAECEVS